MSASENKKKKFKITNVVKVFDLSNILGFERMRHQLPFLLFVVALCVMYIGNHHLSDRNRKAVNKTEKKLNELKWEHVSLKADLDENSKQSKVAERVKEFGLTEITEPPKVLYQD